MRRANYLISEVRPSVFTVKAVSLDEKTGRRTPIEIIIQVQDIPDGINANDIMKRLANSLDFANPPASVLWSKLKLSISGGNNGGKKEN